MTRQTQTQLDHAPDVDANRPAADTKGHLDPAVAIAEGLLNPCDRPACSHEHCGADRAAELAHALRCGVGLDQPELVTMGLVKLVYRVNRRGEGKFCGHRTKLGRDVGAYIEGYMSAQSALRGRTNV